jgi:hypothetical protein
LGVVTEILPGVTSTTAPVPGTEAETEGSTAGETGSDSGADGIGSSTLPEGIVPEMSSPADAPAAEALRPAAEAVTVALLGELVSMVPPAKA